MCRGSAHHEQHGILQAGADFLQRDAVASDPGDHHHANDQGEDQAQGATDTPSQQRQDQQREDQRDPHLVDQRPDDIVECVMGTQHQQVADRDRQGEGFHPVGFLEPLALANRAIWRQQGRAKNGNRHGRDIGQIDPADAPYGKYGIGWRAATQPGQRQHEAAEHEKQRHWPSAEPEHAQRRADQQKCQWIIPIGRGLNVMQAVIAEFRQRHAAMGENHDQRGDATQRVQCIEAGRFLDGHYVINARLLIGKPNIQARLITMIQPFQGEPV